MQYVQTVLSMLRNIRLMDVVDILAVAAIFYLLFALLRSGRSDLALRSLILLLVLSFAVYFAARVLNLAALSTVFRLFWVVVLIIYLIVFQAELRRAILEIGQIRFVRAFIRPGGGNVAILARAVARLADKQLGALFVIERRDPVLPFLVGPGVEIDGLLSEELVVTLFFSYNPLHDGAAIVNGDRIVRASSILPLSKSSEVPKGLGTRHRAGMEITELCDCVSVIVSEETGVVSLVVGGVIERGLDEDSLRKGLEKLLNVRSAEEEAPARA